MTHYPNHVAIVSHRVQGSPMCHLMSFKPSEAPLGNAIRDFFVNSVARNDVPLAPDRQEPSSPAQPPAPSSEIRQKRRVTFHDEVMHVSQCPCDQSLKPLCFYYSLAYAFCI